MGSGAESGLSKIHRNVSPGGTGRQGSPLNELSFTRGLPAFLTFCEKPTAKIFFWIFVQWMVQCKDGTRLDGTVHQCCSPTRDKPINADCVYILLHAAVPQPVTNPQMQTVFTYCWTVHQCCSPTRDKPINAGCFYILLDGTSVLFPNPWQTHKCRLFLHTAPLSSNLSGYSLYLKV